MDEISKLMAKKKAGPEMSDSEKQAKMDVVMELLQMAQEAMADGVKGGLDELSAQKVSVMAPDKESLGEGLEAASEMVDEMPEDGEMAEALLDEETQLAPSDEDPEEMEEAEGDEDDEDEKVVKKRPMFDLL